MECENTGGGVCMWKGVAQSLKERGKKKINLQTLPLSPFLFFFSALLSFTFFSFLYIFTHLNSQDSLGVTDTKGEMEKGEGIPRVLFFLLLLFGGGTCSGKTTR